jgi:hypothetical protein
MKTIVNYGTRAATPEETAMITIIDTILCGAPMESALTVLLSMVFRGMDTLSGDDDQAFDDACEAVVKSLKEGRLVRQAKGATKQ